MPHLLVIDDDPTVRELLDAYARTAGWRVTAARDARAALAALHDASPDVVVLDLMLPDANGWQVLHAIRQLSDVYVLVLSAKGAEADRIGGLMRGADDYMAKPFSPGELMARCQALLRRPRRGTGEDATPPLLEQDGLTLNAATHEVRVDGQPVELTALEFHLLRTFMERPGRVLTREQLADIVWGATDVGAGRVIDVHIGRLRRKLGEPGDVPRFIETLRGVGYRLRARDGRE
jgi:DNA-binding response OmpR family regulator